ncbi:winged helix-turn-helix transcriptional regulator [Natronolimnohabitans sp. A-GB9]|uniref:winged helix-turn-helix transcriptional regulator n=1 Tax=Natronolimnohabitans sp. A-GB9 TaxID=3069757 RepID=UPI0027B2C05E|nr:winged helix-turn-helix transcriptional regulator [Natronolimnohabitans sp. A-GB9]MDQ2052720.1 winged helix-turn-helix transcriptional regulator [Natronolimnohabitans sp. A-GB9]
MSATESDPEVDTEESTGEPVLTELPPSSKLVYKVLEYEGSMTQEEIADESRLCARTVRYALGKLEDEELVTSRVYLEDARQSKYRIAD